MANLDDLLNELPMAPGEQSLDSILNSLPVAPGYKPVAQQTTPSSFDLYGDGTAPSPEASQSILNSPQVQSFKNALGNYVTGVKQSWDELQRAQNAQNDENGVTVMPEVDAEGNPVQLDSAWVRGAKYNLLKDAIGGPAMNVAITPGLPAPVRAVAGVMAAPFVAGDAIDAYNQNKQTAAAQEAAGQEQNPLGPGLQTAKQFLVDPVVELTDKAVNNPGETLQSWAQEPTKLWPELFMPATIAKDIVGKPLAKGAEKIIDSRIARELGDFELPKATDAVGKKGMFDAIFGDKSEEAPQAKYAVQDGVDFAGVKADTRSRVERIIQAYNAEFPDDNLTITDGLRPQEATYGSPTSYHKAGEAIDFVSQGLETDPAKRARLIELAKEHGFGETLDEYSAPSDGATGGHVHIGGLGEKQEGQRSRVAEEVPSKAAEEPVYSSWEEARPDYETALEQGDYQTAVDIARMTDSPLAERAARTMAERNGVDLGQDRVALVDGEARIREALSGERAAEAETKAMPEAVAGDVSVPKSSPLPDVPSGEPVTGTVTRRNIVDKVNELFTKVSTGRLGVRGVLGWFDRNSDVVRTKDYADFRTIMHEIGHYLDKGLDLRKETAFDHELIDAVNRRFGKAYDHLTLEQKRGEGIAEFIHDYTINPERAKQEFPGYFNAFAQRLSQEPQIRGKVEQVKQMLHTWHNQAAQERAKGAISFGDGRGSLQKVIDAAKHPVDTAKSLADKARAAFESGYDKFIDQLAPLDRMMKDIEKITGQKIPLAADVFKQAWLTRGWAGKAQALIENGLPKQGVPALKSIIKSIEKDMQGFSAYVVALRELDAYNLADKTGAKYQHALSRIDAARTVLEGRKNPAFVKAQQDLVAFQNHLLDILVDAGIKDRASVEAMKAKWPNYAPFFREFDEAAMEKFFSTKGFGNVSDPVKVFKGSTRDIINPLESIIKNTYQFINMAERNKVGRLFVDLALRPGLGKLIEKVSGSATNRDSTFSVWNNGRKETYQTTPELYRAVMLLDREPAQGIAKILSIPAGWLRAGAVLSPEFIVRNPVRDAWSAFVYSKYGFIPGVDTFRGLMHFLKKDDLYWEYMNSGAAHAAMVSLDRDYLAQNIREVMSKSAVEKAASVINPKTYLDILRAFSEATEMATRLGEFENARNGYTGVLNRLFGDVRRPASVEEAALGSRDVTLDFSRSGIWGKEANKYVAFWNASVQGTDKMVRSFKEDPAGTSSKVFLSVTLPSIVLWYMNKDDPRYQELPQWQKDIFWIIPTKDTLIKIPKPFEVGILFGTSVERMLQWSEDKAKGNKRNAFKGFGDTVVGAMLPGWIPTAMLPVIEWTTNYSFFMDRDIVPRSQEKLPDKLQYGTNTSAVGKLIGEKLNVSPSKVDNTIRGYTGGLGGLAMTLSDFAAGEFEKRPAMRVSEYPGIRAFTATPYRSSQSVQEFYDKLTEQEQLYNELKLTRQRPEGFNPGEYERLKTAAKLMAQVHKQEKDILANPKMSSEEKRNRLDQLKIMAVNYARIGLGNKEKVR